MKSALPKNWFLEGATVGGRRRLKATLDATEVKSVADLRKWVTMKEAAEHFRVEKSAVYEWAAKKLLRTEKIRGRRLTTAEWIAEFENREIENNG